MPNAAKLAVATSTGAAAAPTLAYIVCGDGVPADVSRIFWAFLGAAAGLFVGIARRDLQR